MVTSSTRSVRKRRFLLNGLVIFTLLYGGLCIYFWTTQVEKVLAPRTGDLSSVVEETLPLTYLQIPARNASGTSLEAVWISSGDDAPAILFLHGQGTTVEANLPHAAFFYQLGYSVLLLEYRGYGRSFGRFLPSEKSLYTDATLALRHLADEMQIPQRQTIVFGHSLGGAVAINIASKTPGLAGVIVESSFTSVLDMSSERYLGLLNFLPVDFMLNERFDSFSKIGLLRIPVLYVHGSEDRIVPKRMSQVLYDETESQKKICIIDGAGHANCWRVGELLYRQTIVSFIEDCTKIPTRLYSLSHDE